MTETLEPVHGAEIANTPWQGGWAWLDPSHGEHYRCCNWCGSIHPEDLAAVGTFHADWADRKYGWPHKFYVDLPNQHPERLYATGATSWVPVGGFSSDRWVLVQDLTVEQRAVVAECGWTISDHHVAFMFGRHSTHHAKFYTRHLADPGLSPESRDRIERACGLRFEFAPTGFVRWWPCVD
jgi:hypothetical protein